jgi:anti-sigma factor RsiW
VSDRPLADGPGGCPFADLLSAYLDDELPAPERIGVERHLLEHGACRRELDEVAEVRQAIRTLPWIDGPAEFWSELAVESSLAAVPEAAGAPIAAQPVAALPAGRRSGRPVPSARWLVGSAAAAFLLIAAGLAGTQVDHASSTPSVTTPSIAPARVGAESLVTSAASGPPVGQQLVVHNDGMDDAMDGVATFLRVP